MREGGGRKEEAEPGSTQGPSLRPDVVWGKDPPLPAPGAALSLGSDSKGSESSPCGLSWPRCSRAWKTLPCPSPHCHLVCPSTLRVIKLSVPTAITPRSPVKHRPQQSPARTPRASPTRLILSLAIYWVSSCPLLGLSGNLQPTLS